MADGSVIFDTKIDESGLRTDLSKLGGKVAKGISVALAAAGTAIAAFGKSAIEVGADFEAGMSNVAAISGATGDEIESLTEKAKEMGAKTKFSASEAADAFSYMAMAGWKTEDMLGGIEGIMNLAAASGEDLATTSDIVTDALTALGMTAADSGHFADVLAAASSNANTNVSLMGETFKYSASMAGALGYSAEDLALAIGLMANSGLKGSMAGTSLNMIMTRLSTNTDGAAKACKDLGVEFFNEDGSARALGDVLSELRVATADMTAEEKTNFANKVAGTAAQKGLLAILNASQGDYDKLANAISTCTDEETGFSAAAQMMETQLDNLQGDLTILKSATEGFKISLYDALSAAKEGNGPLRELTQYATDLVNELNDAVNGERGLSGLAAVVGDVLAKAVAKIAEYLPEFVRMAAELVHGLVQGLTANAGSIAQSAAGLLDIFLDSVLKISTSLVTLGGNLIIALCDGLSANMGNILSVVSDGLIRLVNVIVAYFPQVMQSGADLIVSFVQGLTDAIPQLLAAIPELFSQLMNAILTSGKTILTAVTEIVQLIVDNLPGMLQTLVDMLPGMIQEYADTLVEWYPILAEGIANIITMLAESLPELITILLEALPGLIDTIVTALGEFIPVFIECVMTVVMAIVEALPDIITQIIVVLPTIIDSIIGALLELLPMLVDAGVQLFVALVQALPEIIAGIVGVLPTIIAAVVSALVGMIPQLIQCGIELLTSLVAALPQIIAAIVAVLPTIIMAVISALLDNIPLIIQCGIDLLTSLIANLPQIIATLVMAIPTIIVSLVNAIVSNVGKIAEAGVKLLGSLITNLPSIIVKLVGAIPQIISALVSGFSGFVGKFIEVGKNLLLGIGEGIANAVGTVVAKAKAVASNIWSSVKSFFGIASPSKLFRDSIGKNLVLGLAEGLTDNAKSAITAAEDLASDLADVSFGIQAPEVKAPKVGFDPDDYDFDAIMANVRGTVNATAATTGNAVSAGSTSQAYSKGVDDESAAGSQDERRPMYVYNVLEMDGKTFARVTTPYIEKELDWRDKG